MACYLPDALMEPKTRVQPQSTTPFCLPNLMAYMEVYSLLGLFNHLLPIVPKNRSTCYLLARSLAQP